MLGFQRLWIMKNNVGKALIKPTLSPSKTACRGFKSFCPCHEKARKPFDFKGLRTFLFFCHFCDLSYLLLVSLGFLRVFVAEFVAAFDNEKDTLFGAAE